MKLNDSVDECHRTYRGPEPGFTQHTEMQTSHNECLEKAHCFNGMVHTTGHDMRAVAQYTNLHGKLNEVTFPSSHHTPFHNHKPCFQNALNVLANLLLGKSSPHLAACANTTRNVKVSKSKVALNPTHFRNRPEANFETRRVTFPL